MKRPALAAWTLALVCGAACKQRSQASRVQSVNVRDKSGMMLMIEFEPQTKTYQFKGCPRDSVRGVPVSAEGNFELKLKDCGQALAGYEPLPERLYETLLATKLEYKDLTDEEEQLVGHYAQLRRILTAQAAEAGNQGGNQAQPSAPTQEDQNAVDGTQQIIGEIQGAIDQAGELKSNVMKQLAASPKLSPPARELVDLIKAKIDGLEGVRKKHLKGNYAYNFILDRLRPRNGNPELFYTLAGSAVEEWQWAVTPFEIIKAGGGFRKYKQISDERRWSVLNDRKPLPLARLINGCKGESIPSAAEFLAFYLSRLDHPDLERRRDYSKVESGGPHYWVRDGLAYGPDNLTVTASVYEPGTGKIKSLVLGPKDLESTNAGGFCIDGPVADMAITDGDAMMETVRNAKQQRVDQVNSSLQEKKAAREKLQGKLQRAEQALPGVKDQLKKVRAEADKQNGDLTDDFVQLRAQTEKLAKQLEDGIAELKVKLPSVDESIALLETQLQKEKAGP